VLIDGNIPPVVRGHPARRYATLPGMTAGMSRTTVDSRGAHAMSLSWAQVLGIREDPDDPDEPAVRPAGTAR
jgi:hypothetical protein